MLQAFDAPEMLADGRGVEQRLGRMLAGAVAGVDHRAIHDRGDVGGRAARAVADDQSVGAHRVERARGILERLALLDRAMFDLHRHDLRAEAVGGDFEAQQRPRRIFEEGVDDGQPVEAVVVAARLAIVGEPALALVENDGDVGVAQAVDRKQVHERGH